jgi:phosphoenolpyruvate-protein kinase (PTS system EI component)
MSLSDLLQSNKKDSVYSKISLENKLIVTDEITPKDVIDIYQKQGSGVITSHGSKSSHSAILSKSLSLPMIVKAESSKEVIRDNDDIIMDLIVKLLLLILTNLNLNIIRVFNHTDIHYKKV